MISRARRWIDLAAAMTLTLAVAGPVHGGFIRSLEDVLAYGRDFSYSDARNQIAVFTFEDPQDTELGDAVAFLSSKRVLFEAGVGSLAINVFEQGLSPDDSGLSYFEKVDRVTAGKGFVAALWGHIARDGTDVVVDTFVQLSPERFRHDFDVPGLDGRLRASLTPSRIWVQSLRFPASEIDTIRSIDDSVRTLRSDPSADAEPVDGGYLKQGTKYEVVERSGSWRGLLLYNGDFGWTSVEDWCGVKPVCASVIVGASYLNELLRYANGMPLVTTNSDSYTVAAQTVMDQVSVIKDLRRGVKDLEWAIETSSKWVTRTDAPGRAAFANLRAVSRLYNLAYAGKLDRRSVREVTTELARVSLEDPGNLDLLRNLSVLFRYIGEDEKSTLARQLYEEQLARSSR